MATPHRIVINIRDTSSERTSAQARQTIAWWLIGLTVLMVYFCGMFPFDFSVGLSGALHEIYERFDFTTNQLFTIRQSWLKLIFFMPFGFALGSLLWAWHGLRPHQIVLRCTIAALCSAALSASVELLQVFVTRDPSLADIISKTVGAMLGFGVFILIGEPIVQLLGRLLTAVKKITDPRVFWAAAGIWLFGAMAAPFAARNNGNLSGWEPSFPLLIGNETDGIRHWDGAVSNIWLGAKSLDEDEIERVLAGADPAPRLGDALLTEFQLTGTGPFADTTGHTGALAWTPNFSHGATPGTTQPADLTGLDAIGRFGVPISEGWWLSTARGGAAQVSSRIRDAQAFTLVMDLAMHDLDRGDGWPRIFSISKDAAECNLQLLQDHQNLQLRIRSGATGDGGSDPEFIIPDIFSDTVPHRLVVCFDHGHVCVECSNNGQRFTLQFMPDAWLIWRIFPSDFWHYRLGSSGQAIASGMYRIVALLPIGMLLGAVLRILQQRGRTQNAHLLFIGTICGAAILLEAVLHWAVGLPLSFALPITGLLAACAGTLLIYGRLPLHRRWV